MKPNKDEADYRSIHAAILRGSLSFVGMRVERESYVGARELQFRIFPGSGLFNKKPKWLVAAEIAATERTYARCVAEVEPAWVEVAGQTELKERVSNPYWDVKRAQAMTLLDASLYGLPVIKDRRVALVPHDRETARRLFVQHALVQECKQLRAAVVTKNRKLVAECTEQHATERRDDLIASENSLVEFYLDRLPTVVCDIRSFHFWYRKHRKEADRSLAMQIDDVLLRGNIHKRDDAFPSEMKVGDSDAPLKYRFAPGEIDDGTSLRVIVSQLPYVKQEDIDWLVPGFFEQKCIELLKTLPRATRKQLAPVPDHVEELLPELLREGVYREGSLISALGHWVKALFNVTVNGDDFDISRLAPFLHMNVQVVDNKGKVLDQSRDLIPLQERVLGNLQRSMDDSFRTRHERRGLTVFPEEGLRLSRVVKSKAGSITVFPVLVDRGDCVDLRLQLDARMQIEQTQVGLCRLLMLAERQSVKYLRAEIRREQQIKSNLAGLCTPAEFEDSLLLGAIRQVYFNDRTHIETRNEFERALAEHRGELVKVGLELLDLAVSALKSRQEIARAAQRLSRPAFEITKTDLLTQLQRLMPPDFLSTSGASRLRELPRYLEAMKHRIDNLDGRLKRDIEHTREIQTWESRLDSLTSANGYDHKARNLSYLIQEYRIALFCQSMRTRERISAKRLQKLFDSAESEAVQMQS